MADVYQVFKQSFTSTDSIVVEHDANSDALSVRVLINGVVDNDLVESIVCDLSDPRNVFTVILTSVQTGVIQVVTSGLTPVSPAVTIGQAVSMYSSNDSDVFDSTAINVPFDEVQTNMSSGLYTTDTDDGEITILKDGTYKLSYDVSTKLDSNDGNTVTKAYFENDSNEIEGTSSYIYNADDGETSGYGSGSMTTVIDLVVDNVIRVRVEQDEGSSDLKAIAYACGMTITSLT